MAVIVTHQQQMTFSGTSSDGYAVRMDSSREAGGTGQGVRPMEMLLLGLGGCTGIDVVSILEKMRMPFDSFQMVLQGERADNHPKIYTQITIRYQFTGSSLDVEKVRRAVSLSQEKYCSASAMLGQSATITAVLEFNGQDVGVL